MTWIIPKNLQQLSGVPDTEGYSLDLDELSRICEPLLTARSKPSRWQTWLRRWKRESWMQHLYGRILKPSQAQNFTKKWTCLWPDTHASHSAAQGSAEEQTTHATSGRTFETQLDLFSQDTASLRTSKDTYRLDSPQLSATWKKMVTEQRGEYSARRKSAPHTAESGCLSSQKGWATPNTMDNLPPKQGEALARNKKKGGCRNLREDVVNPQMNWPTTTARDYKGCGNAVDRKDGKSRMDTSEAVVKFGGQRDPENNSTNGSRRECLMYQRPGFIGTESLTGMENWQTIEARNNKGYHNQKDGSRVLKLGSQAGSGKLNPRWVSCLMNVPVMWTEP